MSANASPSAITAAETLKQLMIAADIPSYRALARIADVSDWAVQQLRRDRIATMRVQTLQQLATALHVSLPQLLQHFGAMASAENDGLPAVADDRASRLEAEYARLQAQLTQQENQVRQQVQQEALTVLESWMRQWPTAAHAVAKNPDLPASRLLPLVQPVQNLLDHWDVSAIAAVGTEVAFDPQEHQLMSGTANPGDKVKVRYAGYRQGEKLLHRAQVSPVA